MIGLDELIRRALAEDIGPGDITTRLLVEPGQAGEARALAGQRLVVAGLWVFARVFQLLDPAVRVSPLVEEGQWCEAGQALAELRGPLGPMLSGERTALNFLQRLSGIATLTRRFVERARGVRILDTRKTTPGMRLLEKYAVRVGGGGNHRMGLFDGVLIKDNHIRACGSVAEALRRARRGAPPGLRIEVEVETLEQLEEALQGGAEVVMLDNMSPEAMAEAIGRARGRALVEISGGVTLERVEELARLGPDFISVGALTHSAPAPDIRLEVV